MTPDYSTFCCQVNRLDVGLEPHLDHEKPVTITVDAYGIKVTDKGEWIRTKWKRPRGFLKIQSDT